MPRLSQTSCRVCDGCAVTLMLTRGPWLLAAVVGLLALQWLLPAAPERLGAAAWHDAAHIVWFAAVALILSAWLTGQGHSGWWLPALLLGLASASELLQLVPDRADWIRNVLGALLGWLGWRWRKQRLRLLLLLAVMLLATVSGPLMLAYAKAQRSAGAPTLFDPAQFGWQTLVSATADADWSAQRLELDGRSRRALTVTVNKRPWSGVRLRELDQSWEDYQRLLIEVSLNAPGSGPSSLAWYVGTRHLGDTQAGATRSVRFTLRPGLQQLVVPLDALTPGDGGASLVSELLFYSQPEFAGQRWHLLGVTLR